MRLKNTSILALVLLGCLVVLSHAEDIMDDDEDIVVSDDAGFDDEGIVEDEEEESPELNVPKEERPVYKAPVAQGSTHLSDAFESEADYKRNWVQSSAKKEDTDENIAKYDGVWSIEEPADNALQGDLSLVLKSKAKHHATAAKLKKPFNFNGKPFIVQYEVKFQNGQECGGAYIKLLSKEGNSDLRGFYDKSPYTIMFGPDKCGNDNKLHFIFRHKNPITGEFEEKHAKKPTATLDTFFTDKRTHLYTLVVKPDNTFEIYVDQNLVNSGSLLEDMTPPVNPPKEITDPDDKKPEDWDEREKIQDPDADKPDDWDESEPEKISDAAAEMPAGWLEDENELLPDEDSEKPNDWDDDMDGEWEPPMIANPKCEDAPGCGPWTRPMIKNPKYKGKWRAPMIDNPSYKGKWTARTIPNPTYFEDSEPYKMTSIGAVGLELWSMSDDIAFDNFIITDDKSVADRWAADSWELKHSQELSGGGGGRSVVDAIVDATNERPWLWAVIILVVVLPIVLVIAYCCFPFSGGAKQSEIEKSKKTDEASPDDKPEDKEEDKEEDDEDEDEDEEEEDEEKEEEKKEEEKVTSAGDAKKKGKSQLEANDNGGEADGEDEADEEGEDKDAKTQSRSSPRKRKGKKASMD